MRNKGENTIFRSISAAFLILIMHVLLIGIIGALVLLFYGIVNHTVLIIVGISFLCIGGYWIFRRIRASGQAFKNMTGESFKGKTVEVSFLGGIANLTISDSPPGQHVLDDPSRNIKQLPPPATDTIQDLAELARLYENNLITTEEYRKAKEKFFR